jgi:DNA-binding NarL/FixJ family response regulator
VRVVIADDSALLREGVAKLLEEDGFEVVGRARDADDLLQKVRSYEPDVAIVDVRMPPTLKDEGARAAEEIRSAWPHVGVLLLSQVVELEVAMRLFAERPQGFGYLLKDRVLELEDFVDAVRRVARGGTAIDPEVVAQLLGRRASHEPLETLTERERGVLALMAEGRSNHGIGSKLFLSSKTVESHVHHIFTKLALEPADDDHRRVLAVLAYLGSSSATMTPSPTGAKPNLA